VWFVVRVFHPRRIIFANHRGYLRKKGGGTSLFGRRNWKERFCVFQRGVSPRSPPSMSARTGGGRLRSPANGSLTHPPASL